MNGPDELQKLWQLEKQTEDKDMIWIRLIQEKHAAFDDLKRAGNQSEYLVTMFLSPLLAFVAWRAKFPVVQAGYGLLAVTFVMVAIVTRLEQAKWPRKNDHNLRTHVQELIQSYDDRIRFLGTFKFWVSIPICVGVAAVILGIPGDTANRGAWALVFVVLIAFLTGQWWSYKRAAASISEKRGDAARLLIDLSAADGDL